MTNSVYEKDYDPDFKSVTPNATPVASKATKAKSKDKLFPVKLLRNYRPAGKFKVVDVDEKGVETMRDPIGDQESENQLATGDYAKVFKKTKIYLDVEEAKVAIDRKIAERADEIAI